MSAFTSISEVAPDGNRPSFEDILRIGLNDGGNLKVLNVLEERPGPEQRKERERETGQIIDYFADQLQQHTTTHIGYPCNLSFDYSRMDVLNKYVLNNAGDPFKEVTNSIHSRPFEIDSKDYWGYVTTGGTEGNMHGLYVARENLPDGILYTSTETHYSVFKAARILRIQYERIPALMTGEIDYEGLRSALEKNRHLPAILNLNVGTTIKGAVDDLDRILDILSATGFSEERFHVHCDGALFGMMLPFLQREDAPMVTFKKPIGSVSVSGHKFIGSPFPCGVVMTRKSLVRAVMHDVEYINSVDATISGSRSGQTAVYMWYALSLKGHTGLKKDAEKCVRNALLLKSMLERAGVSVFLNELSNTVVFERPRNLALLKRWQVPCDGKVAHVVVMPHVEICQLQSFVMELTQVSTTIVEHSS